MSRGLSSRSVMTLTMCQAYGRHMKFFRRRIQDTSPVAIGHACETLGVNDVAVPYTVTASGEYSEATGDAAVATGEWRTFDPRSVSEAVGVYSQVDCSPAVAEADGGPL